MNQPTYAGTTARLVGGPATGHIVDLTLTQPSPSDQVFVQIYEGVALAIDQLENTPATTQADLVAAGWVRYLRAPVVPPQGRPWQYVCHGQ